MSENRVTPTWENAGVEADIIYIQTAPQPWADYKIRIKINGKYYVGELELSE